MTLERYQELSNSKTCYKIDIGNQILLVSQTGKLLIQINCITSKNFPELNKDSESRVLIFVYPPLESHSALEVDHITDNDVMIMIDCENNDRATSYQLTIDEDKEEVLLKICDFPNLERMNVSQKEILGIRKKIWKPNKFNAWE